jgi:Family of unknown function (DUF5329)
VKAQSRSGAWWRLTRFSTARAVGVASGLAWLLALRGFQRRRVAACLVGAPAWFVRRRIVARPMKRLLAASYVIGSALAATASPLPPPARAEVVELLSRLEASGCQFNRNGIWYSGSAAKDHLTLKLAYIESNAAPTSAENFIELAASTSSASGKPYQVRCGTSAPVTSSTWLDQQLRLIRSSRTPSGSK